MCTAVQRPFCPFVSPRSGEVHSPALYARRVAQTSEISHTNVSRIGAPWKFHHHPVVNGYRAFTGQFASAQVSSDAPQTDAGPRHGSAVPVRQPTPSLGVGTPGQRPVTARAVQRAPLRVSNISTRPSTTSQASSLASSASPVRVGRSIKDSGSVPTRRLGSSPRPQSFLQMTPPDSHRHRRVSPDSGHHVAVACAAEASPDRRTDDSVRSCPVAHVGMSRMPVPGEGLATKQTQNGLGDASLQPCISRGADDLPPRARDHMVTLAAAVKQRSRERTSPRPQEEQETKPHKKTLKVLVQPVPHEEAEHPKQFQEVQMEQPQPQQELLEPFAANTEAKQGLQFPDGSLPELGLRQAAPVDPSLDVAVTRSPRHTMVSHAVDPERATMLRLFRRHAHGAWLVAKAKDMAMTCGMEDEEAAVTSIANTLKTEESYLLACRNIFDRFGEKALKEDGGYVCELPLSTIAEVLKLWNINGDHGYTFFALLRKERSEWFEGELPVAIDSDVFETTFKKFLRRIRDHICNTQITKENFVHTHERRGSFEREFTEGAWVGAGAFGDCCLVTNNYTEKTCVMKKIPKCNAMVPVEELDFELQALRSLDHPNVVRVFESFDAEDHIALILEVARGGDLKLKLAKAKEDGKTSLEHKFVRNIMHQGVKGLAYVHSKCIIHRDIKPENLLLTQDGVLKIADFGWAVDLRERPSNLAGTFCYMAPEVLEEVEVQTPAVDVWSAGASFTELLTGLTLKDAVDEVRDEDHHSVNMAMRDRFLKAAKTYPPREEARPSHVSSECWDCLRSMLTVDSSRRATLPAALRHAWLRNHHQRGLVSGRPTLPISQVIGFGPHANVRTSMPQPPPGSRVSPIRSGTITARGVPGELRFKRAR
mmetsp:Transcript_8582/g.23895  ORF Transcript_8582/g.23895 Transcript_8582/m.23895 type:complete len:879 (-) Transcript_8582:515-3151(-)